MKKSTQNIITILGLVGMVVVFFVGVWFLKQSSTIGHGYASKTWSKTLMAQSSFYYITEDMSRSKNDTIYLHVDGIDEEGIYHCYVSGTSKSCGLRFGNMAITNGSDDLGGYFWLINQDEISAIASKYPALSDKKYYIKAKSETELLAFAEELLQKLPDIYKVYQAYLEARQINASSAGDEFGYAYVEFVDQSGKRLDYQLLFDWMAAQGLE